MWLSTRVTELLVARLVWNKSLIMKLYLIYLEIPNYLRPLNVTSWLHLFITPCYMKKNNISCKCNPFLLRGGYVFWVFAISRIAPKLLHQFTKGLKNSVIWSHGVVLADLKRKIKYVIQTCNICDVQNTCCHAHNNKMFAKISWPSLAELD